MNISENTPKVNQIQNSSIGIELEDKVSQDQVSQIFFNTFSTNDSPQIVNAPLASHEFSSSVSNHEYPSVKISVECQLEEKFIQDNAVSQKDEEQKVEKKVTHHDIKAKIQDRFDNSKLSNAYNIKNGEKLHAGHDPETIQKDFKAGKLAHIDFENGVAKFFVKPKKDYITVDGPNGPVKLKCIEMNAEEKAALENDLKELKSLHSEYKALKESEEKKKTKGSHGTPAEIVNGTETKAAGVQKNKKTDPLVQKVVSRFFRSLSQITDTNRSIRQKAIEQIKQDQELTEKFLRILNKSIKSDELNIRIKKTGIEISYNKTDRENSNIQKQQSTVVSWTYSTQATPEIVSKLSKQILNLNGMLVGQR